jgi:hypothetical protein
MSGHRGPWRIFQFWAGFAAFAFRMANTGRIAAMVL